MRECTFHPKVGGTAFLETSRGGISLGFLERSSMWQNLKQNRLTLERAVQEEAESRLLRRGSILHVSESGIEPRFMAPTMSAGHRCAVDVPLSVWDESGVLAHSIPEWAAPLADCPLVSTFDGHEPQV